MISDIAYFQILGIPIVAYAGVLTFLCFSFTALIGYLNLHGNRSIPFKFHPAMALTSICIGLLHALLGLSILFKW